MMMVMMMIMGGSTIISNPGEIEELAGRLKASRQRVSDLERNGVTLNSSNQKLEKQTKELSKELDRLKIDVYKNKWVGLV